MKTAGYKQIEDIRLHAACEQPNLLSPAKFEQATAQQPSKPNQHNASTTKGNSIRSRSKWIYFAAFGLVCLCAGGGAYLSELGMDWGYYSLASIIGTPADCDGQAFGAGFLAFFVAPAIYAAATIPVLRGLLGGNKWLWRSMIPIIVFGTGSTCLSGDLSVMPWLAGVSSGAIIISAGFDWIYTELSRRVKAKLLLSSLFIAIAPSALLLFSQKDFSKRIIEEFVTYSALIFAVSFLAPISIRATKQSAANAAAFFATLPVILFNLLNIIFTVFCGTVGNFIGSSFGWQALLSALMISLVTATISAGGAACGCLFVRIKLGTRYLLK